MDDLTYINDKPLCSFGGLLGENYEVGQSSLKYETLTTANGAGLVVAGRTIGLRSIVLPIDIYGSTSEDAQHRVSLLLRELASGTVKLGLPDGFLYFAVLTGQGGPTIITKAAVALSLTFQGIRCKPMEQAVGHEFEVYGTMPEMNCRLSVTVGADAQTYQLGGIAFDGGEHTSGLKRGDVIVVDGMEKTVTINGSPAMDRCDLITFPTVHPGSNVIEAADPVTLEYYPAYL